LRGRVGWGVTMEAAKKIEHSKLQMTQAVQSEYAHIFASDALDFVAELVQNFDAERVRLLEARKARQHQFDSGELPDFRADTANIRSAEWQVSCDEILDNYDGDSRSGFANVVSNIPKALQDRRVEITGPAEPKMIINALNSGAKVFMVDFEDSLSPTWERVAEGQAALYDAVRHKLQFTSPEGKEYKLAEKLATLIVRPRGWHMPEKHVLFNNAPIAGAFLDFGLFLFHNGTYQFERGEGPFFYLPKLEGAEEAALWAKIFDYSEKRVGLKQGSIKATVLIETIPAAFEMEEILYALRPYAVGLNCGRWDYIFSFIKKFHTRPDFVLPDRAQVTMNTHFLKSYSELLIKTCHKRGAFAMGGMAPQIPIKGNADANDAAMEKVKADKLREVTWGHDGTWVAHPALIPFAMAVYDEHMPTPNQLHVKRDEVEIKASDLLTVPKGTITEAGLRNNVNVCIQYMANWMAGNGCVPLFNLMEDAATAEISRTQLWQWVHHAAGVLEDGRNIDFTFIKNVIAEELQAIKAQIGEEIFNAGNYVKAAKMLEDQTISNTYTEFLTLPAYEMLG
jgi:malate synthase